MTAQMAARLFGVVFIAIGLLGFVPALVPDGKLLGIFEVNALHNLIHLASGVAALVLSSSYANAKLYFKVFAVVYGLVTLLGLVYGNEPILGLVSNNYADVLLHVAITAGAAYFGFRKTEDPIAA